jgi:O-antigen/teichoic acid export membrane protein
MTHRLMSAVTHLLPRRLGERVRRSERAQRIGLNLAWLGIDKVYATLLATVVSIFVARYLGKSGFGLFSYTLAYATLFRVLGDMGLEEVLVRDLVKYPEQRYEILGTAWGMRIGGALAAMTLIAISVQFVKRDDLLARHLVMISSLIYVPQSSMGIYRWFSARLLAKYNVLASNAALTMMSVARLLMVYYKLSLVWFVWTNVGLVLFNAIFLWVFYIASGESVRQWRFRRSWCRRLFHDAWPQIPNGLAGAIQSQFGALIVENMLGDARLGAYAVAYRFYALLLVVPDIVSQSLVPTLTELKHSNPPLFERRMEQSYRLLFFLYLLTLIPMLILCFGGIQLLYGKEFAEAGKLVMMFAIPLPLIYFGQLRMWYLIIDNRIRHLMNTAIFQAVGSIVANYLLIRWFGAGGAIMAVGAGAVVAFALDAWSEPARKNLSILLRSLRPQNL